MEISSKDSARLDELGTRAVGGAAGLSERTTERREAAEGGFAGSAGGILSFKLRSDPPATVRHARPLRRRRCALSLSPRHPSHPSRLLPRPHRHPRAVCALSVSLHSAGTAHLSARSQSTLPSASAYSKSPASHTRWSSSCHLCPRI